MGSGFFAPRCHTGPGLPLSPSPPPLPPLPPSPPLYSYSTSIPLLPHPLLFCCARSVPLSSLFSLFILAKERVGKRREEGEKSFEAEFNKQASPFSF